MECRFAAVVVNRIINSTDKIFYYCVPEGMKVFSGSAVLVPFGRLELEGIVVGLLEKVDIQPDKIKPIHSLLADRPLFTPELLDLARHLSEYYLSPWVKMLQAMLPAGLSLSGKMPAASHRRLLYLKEPVNTEALHRAPQQLQAVQFLQKQNGSSLREISAATGVKPSVIRALIQKGFVYYKEEICWPDCSLPSAQGPVLNTQQLMALSAVQDEASGERRPILLHGVTGSGKTEIYLRLAQEELARGKQVLILVPEISLTPQTVSVFARRLNEPVAVLHSGLTGTERRQMWLGLALGHYRVVIGARSAVFAPLTNLGLIVVDEEQEASYKQENVPRFHAMTAALFRAEQNNAVLILGSATPSVESYFRAERGDFRLVELQDRIYKRPLPGISLVDMRQELRCGNMSVFSRLLKEKISAALARGEQTMLFLNRRGYDTSVVCRMCGHTITCPHCSIALAYHEEGQNLKCHYCGYTTALPLVCPSCGSKAIRYLGSGTQKIVAQAQSLFPAARVVRVDKDSTSSREALPELYREIREGRADIIVGTQIIAKGWDIPGVTLVGVMAADTSLNLPEFRSGERTFQLLTQVAGRAGRHRPGEVVVQTYQPENNIIQLSLSQDYKRFYKQEVCRRQLCGYPPFSCFIRMVFAGEDQDTVRLASFNAADLWRDISSGKIDIWGASPAPYSKIKDRFRYQIILRGNDLTALRAFAKKGVSLWQASCSLAKKVVLSIDVEPLSMM